MTDRIRGRRLQERNKRLLLHEPLCRNCRSQGKIRLAEEVDHVVPLYKGGRDTESNLQPLCSDCHDQKTITERGDKYIHKSKQPQGLDWVGGLQKK